MADAPWIVSDELWELIEPLLPNKERRFRYPGRKRLPDRKGFLKAGYPSDAPNPSHVMKPSVLQVPLDSLGIAELDPRSSDRSQL